VSDVRRRIDALVPTNERTLDWARREIAVLDPARPESGLAKLVLVASTYATYCAPSAAPQRAFDLAARFILLFLLVDDAEKADAEGLVAPSGERWAIGRFTPALSSWLADCQEHFECCEPALAGTFEQSFHDYLVARADELRATTRPRTVEAHLAFRRRTIFLEPYIDLWMILLGIAPSEVAALDATRSAVIDVVLLANDLGSVARDGAGGEAPDDLNLVTTVAAERLCSTEQAVDHLVEQHNVLVARLRDELGASDTGEHTAPYADVLAGMADGNLDALLALRFRYPGAGATLGRLDRVRPLPM
jgi:hypothetical protein